MEVLLLMLLEVLVLLEVLEVVLLEVLEVRGAPDLHCGESPGSEVVQGAPGWEILLIV